MKYILLLVSIIAALTLTLVMLISKEVTEETHHTLEITPPKTSSISTESPEEAKMIELTNDYRTKHNLSALTENSLLMTSAQMKADVLCESGEWTHTPNGQKFYKEIVASGYSYHKAGENLAKGFNSTKGAFEALLDSPTHLENIEGDYKEIGVGFAECGGNNYYVMHYGSS